MSPKNGASGSPGVDKAPFVIPAAAQPVYRATTRDPMGIMISPTGLGVSNAAGYDAFCSQAKTQTFDPKQFGIIAGGDEGTGRVMAWVVEPTTPGNTAVRLNTQKKTATIYLHALFAAKPGLRPDTRRWCPMKPDVDSDGLPCIVIYLRGLDERKATRKPGAPPPA